MPKKPISVKRGRKPAPPEPPPKGIYIFPVLPGEVWTCDPRDLVEQCDEFCIIGARPVKPRKRRNGERDAEILRLDADDKTEGDIIHHFKRKGILISRGVINQVRHRA